MDQIIKFKASSDVNAKKMVVVWNRPSLILLGKIRMIFPLSNWRRAVVGRWWSMNLQIIFGVTFLNWNHISYPIQLIIYLSLTVKLQKPFWQEKNLTLASFLNSSGISVSSFVIRWFHHQNIGWCWRNIWVQLLM